MAHRVTFTSRNGDRVAAAEAAPAGAARVGAVIVIHEWWGLIPQIERTVDRLAEAGFLALAPDLFRGDHAELSDSKKANRLMSELDGARAMADLGGALDHLLDHPRGNGKVAVLGFCMGGAYSFAAACHLRGLAAAVPFYGLPPHPDWSKVDVPILAHFASRDGWAKPAAAEEIQRTLAARGQRMDLHVYQADHAFMNEARPEVHDAAAAALAWERTLDFLRRQLG